MASAETMIIKESMLAKMSRRFQRAPVESLAIVLIGPWIMTSIGRGAWRLVTETPEENPKYHVLRKKISSASTTTTTTTDESGVEDGKRAVIKYRGKTFVQTESKETVDLSWFGAIPYWIPVCLIGLEGFLVLRDGVGHFVRRGYSPAQRHLIQGYVFFAVLPVVDLLSGDDWANPTKEQQRDRRLAYRFRLPLYLWTLFEFITTAGAFRTILDFNNGLSKRSRWALIMQLGLFNGAFGINVAHELLHKNNRFENALAWALLTNVNYCHWNDEHEVGHHMHVATPLDPATAREGETVYSFLPRSFAGGFRSACHLEQQRLLKEENISIWYTPKNRVLRGILGSAVWALILAKLSKSKWAIPLFYFQGLFGALLLEVVNYMEHFGLLRKQDPVTGEYEPVDPRHSWNAPNRFSNTILFKLQRHSDHHTFPTRPYEILRNFVESPQLPNGYIGMFTLAVVPRAFFWIMNPLLEAHRLEFNADREPTESELGKVGELKLLARRRIWTWTLSNFGITTAAILFAFRQ